MLAKMRGCSESGAGNLLSVLSCGVTSTPCGLVPPGSSIDMSLAVTHAK